MKREGFAFTGAGAIAIKELTDHLTGFRMFLLQFLTVLAAIGSVYAAGRMLTQGDGQDAFIFLRLFSTSLDPLPSFVTFVSLLVPLMAIALGFDSVNGEFGRRSMSRLLSLPIYRDAVLLGKLLGALAALTLMLTALWLLVLGLGILMLGIPPSGEEVLRAFAFLIATIGYAGIWLSVAIFCSVALRQPATAALAALAIWLVLTLFWPIVAETITGLFPPTTLEAVEMQAWIGRISPQTLYAEITLALLAPETRSLGPVMMSQLYGALIGSPLGFGQSVLLVWPHLAGIVAVPILLFTGAYLIFQRQEVRA